MRMILAAAAMAALVGAAGAASATTFTGSYTATVFSSGSGLEIETQDTTPNPPSGTGFTFNLAGNGSSADVSLFKIWTEEDSVDSSDETHRPISVFFSFTAPGSANGTVGGETYGIDGVVNSGHVHWNGPATINFGGGFGTLTVTLNDADFNAYDPPGNGNNEDLYPTNHPDARAAQITGHFALSNVPGGVPEPATWGLMITGFGMAGATLRRRRTAATTA